MPAEFLDIAMTPDVMDVQHEMGSDELWQAPHRQRRGERFGASEEAMMSVFDGLPAACQAENLRHRRGCGGGCRPAAAGAGGPGELSGPD